MKNGAKGETEAQETSLIALEGIRLRVLYDNYPYAEGFEAQWGFSCLIEGTKETILFDTGGDGTTLMKTIEAGKIDPGIVDKIFLSHIHSFKFIQGCFYQHTINRFAWLNPDVKEDRINWFIMHIVANNYTVYYTPNSGVIIKFT